MERLEAVLECQDCGRFLRTLSLTETQDMVDRPYSWVVRCHQCDRDYVRSVLAEAL